MITLDSAPLPPALQTLRLTATVVINQHINAGGLCAVCGSAFPCERAQLADTALGSL
jgi:hypothetical protein